MIKRWFDDKLQNNPSDLFYTAMIIILVFAFLVNTFLAVFYG